MDLISTSDAMVATAGPGTEGAHPASAADGPLTFVLAPLFDAWSRSAGAMWAVKDAAEGRYLGVSEAYAEFLGRSQDGIVGHMDAELLDGALAATLRAADLTAQTHGAALTAEHKFEWNGRRHDYSVLRLAGSAGGRSWIASVWQDQSPTRQREAQQRAALEQLEQQQRANEDLRRELRDQGLRDLQTGLYTRGHFEDQLRREVDLSTREHREFALVYIALDAFGPRVLALGQRAQERVLEAIGRLLRSNTRAMDASCRLDERRFGVLLSGVGLATAHARMEGLRRQCATQIVVLDGQELGFTVSMGVASFPHTAHSQDELLSACESALAEAHRRGGNTIALASIKFDPV